MKDINFTVPAVWYSSHDKKSDNLKEDFLKIVFMDIFSQKSPMLIPGFERNLNEYGSILNKLDQINLNVLLNIE
jgi:hypothetical protein